MCDALCALPAATADGVARYAKNADRPPAEAQRLARHPPRREATTSTTYLEVRGHSSDTLDVLGSRPAWMWGFEHGVNEVGVAAGNQAIFTTLDPRPFPDALVGMDLVRLGLERASTAVEAVEVMTGLLERHGQGGSGHEEARRPYWSSFLVVDPTTAYVLETSGTTWMAEAVERTRAVSNRTSIAAFDDAYRHPDQPDELVVPRWDAGREVLAAEPVTTEALVRHLRCHAGCDGYTVCMHVDGVEATTASIVAELPAVGRPLVRVLAGSPCRSLYVPLFVGREVGTPVAHERFVALGDEHRAALDALEAELAADATDDDGWGPEAWHRVDASLRELSGSSR